MKDREDEISSNYPHHGSASRLPLVVRTDSDFQGQVLEKLGRLEAKMDMLVGSGQPGRMSWRRIESFFWKRAKFAGASMTGL